MKKTLLLLLWAAISHAYAQLDKVSPVTSVIHDAAKVEGLNVLINTKDFTSSFTAGVDKFPTTVQLCHISKAFPPIWYQIGVGKKAAGGLLGSDFYLDPELGARGHLSFSFVSLADTLHPIDGFVFLDTTSMESVDTLTPSDFTFDSIYQAIDDHECVEDIHGNKMFFSTVETRVDGRCLSGIPADSLMKIAVQYIVILDSANHLKMIWNPLAHMSPCEMIWAYRNSSTTYPGAVNWSHGNSLRFALDGNILYSYRHIGLGKININTGDIMWKLGGKDSSAANYIPVPDSITYALQHDFYQRKDGKYSLFSNGNTTNLTYMQGLIYDIDEVHKTASLADRFIPQPTCRSNALGSFEEYNNMYILNKGLEFCTNQIIDIVNKNDKSAVAELYGRLLNFSYRAHVTEWNISRRPVARLEGDSLKTDSIPGLYGYTWYQVDDTSAVKVGTGLSIPATLALSYVVEAKADTGIFISYLLSDVIHVPLTSVRNNIADKIACFYNSDANIMNIDLKRSDGLLRVYDVAGKEIKSVTLNRNDNQIYFKPASGIYIFDITAGDAHLATKVFVP